MIETLQALPFLHALETIRTPFLNTVMTVITLFGHEVIPIAIICLFYWCINKKTAYQLGLVFFASGVAAQTLKIGFRVERPFDLDTSLTYIDGSFVNCSGYSLPSGHTQAATSLYFSLALYFKKLYVKLALILLTFAVIFSRLYLGVHTPLDVGVSFIVTLFIVLVLFPLSKKLLSSHKPDLAVALVIFTICLGVLVYATVLYTNGTVLYNKISDSFKTVGSGLGFATGYYVERRFVNFSEQSKNVRMQILKAALGIGSALALKAGLKAIFGENIYSDACRYAFLVFWIIALYPMIIKKFFQSEK